MAELKNSDFLNSKGQSLVEYILLLAVISSIGFALFNSQKFKNFFGGTGFFETFRHGIEYSYRYGREMKGPEDHERGMDFSYGSRAHDTYWNNSKGQSRFFTGTEDYGSR